MEITILGTGCSKCKTLEGKKTFTGNVMASTPGIVTPFCSCSAIPLFLGFVESGVPPGVTFIGIAGWNYDFGVFVQYLVLINILLLVSSVKYQM